MVTWHCFIANLKKKNICSITYIQRITKMWCISHECHDDVHIYYAPIVRSALSSFETADGLTHRYLKLSKNCRTDRTSTPSCYTSTFLDPKQHPTAAASRGFTHTEYNPLWCRTTGSNASSRPRFRPREFWFKDFQGSSTQRREASRDRG